MASSGVAGSICGEVVVVTAVELGSLGVVATGRITELVIVVGEAVNGTVLVDRNDEGGDVGDDVGINEDDGATVMVVLSSVEVVKGCVVEVDVVVVGSGCVVVVLNNVVKDSVVVGGSVVVVVSSHVVTVLLCMVDEVGCSVVVVISWSVDVVMLDDVVTCDVVGWTCSEDVSRSY